MITHVTTTLSAIGTPPNTGIVKAVLLSSSSASVDAMLAKAQEDIRMERENAMRQMKGDVASLAMEAAAKIIGKNSGADQDLSLYDQFIEKAGDPDDSDRR